MIIDEAKHLYGVMTESRQTILDLALRSKRLVSAQYEELANLFEEHGLLDGAKQLRQKAVTRR